MSNTVGVRVPYPYLFGASWRQPLTPPWDPPGLGGVPRLVCYDIVPFLCPPMRVIPLQRILRFAPNCDTIHGQPYCLLRSLRSIDAPLNVVLVPALVHYPTCLPPCHTTLQPHHNRHFSSVRPPQAFPLTHSRLLGAVSLSQHGNYDEHTHRAQYRRLHQPRT